MDETNYTTEHRKGQPLTSEERHIIEVRYNRDKQTIYGIAKEIGRPYNTVKNEIARGTVSLYNGKVSRYKADVGYSVYLEHRRECRRKYRCLETSVLRDSFPLEEKFQRMFLLFVQVPLLFFGRESCKQSVLWYVHKNRLLRILHLTKSVKIIICKYYTTESEDFLILTPVAAVSLRRTRSRICRYSFLRTKGRSTRTRRSRQAYP